MRGDVNKDSPKAFADHIPGNWSSHPAAMSRQRPVLILISILPIAVFLLCGAFVLTDFDSWVGMFRHASVVLLVAGSAVSFFFGATMTLLTLRIVGRVNAHRKVGLHGRDELPMPLGMMLAFGFFWLVPWALSCFRNRLWDGPYFHQQYLLKSSQKGNANDLMTHLTNIFPVLQPDLDHLPYALIPIDDGLVTGLARFNELLCSALAMVPVRERNNHAGKKRT